MFFMFKLTYFDMSPKILQIFCCCVIILLNLFWHLLLTAGLIDTLDMKNRSKLNNNTGSQVAVQDASQEKDFINHELIKSYKVSRILIV